ncbi:MAG: hypothetical protein ABEK16_03865 [Candidatus Nanohalobium sp.]
MNSDRFESDLGEVAVTKTHVERRRNDSEEWERITDNFSEEKLVDEAEYVDIEDMELEKGSIYPNIRLKVDGDWKRMFFHVGDEAEECFKRLKYRWNAFHQNY